MVVHNVKTFHLFFVFSLTMLSYDWPARLPHASPSSALGIVVFKAQTLHYESNYQRFSYSLF